MAPLGTLSWIAAALLGLGLAAAALNLLRGRALALSGLFAVLFAGGLWGLLGLPAHQVPFAVLGTGAVGGALVLVFSPGPRTSVQGLLLLSLCLSGLFLILGFPFLAAAQTIVHVGAIGALGLLVLRTLDLGTPEVTPMRIAGLRPSLAGPILAGALAGMAMVGVVATGGIDAAIDPAALAIREPQVAASVAGGGELGHLLYGNHHQAGETAPGPLATSRLRTVFAGKHLLPLEATAVLLLAALIGLTVLGLGPRKAPGKEE